MRTLLRESIRRISPKAAVAFLLGNALLALCGLLWLKIPDSHVWQLGLSLVIGVALVGAFFWLQVKVVRAIRRPLEPLALRIGAPLAAVWVVVLYVLRLPMGPMQAGVFTRASYWNSRLSAHSRTVFTYTRLYEWQNEAIAIVFGFVVPALLLPFVVETVCRRGLGVSLRSALGCLGRWVYWVAAAVVCWLLPWVTSHLVDWQPGKGVSAQIFSVILRLMVIYVVNGALVLLLLGVTAETLERGAGRNAAL